MDPPLISEGSFATANPSLAEIWPFNGGGRGGEVGDMSGLLGLRIAGDGGGFEPGMMGGFVDLACGGVVNRDGSIEESTVTEQSRSVGGCGVRKRRAMAPEDESSKMFSATPTTTTNSGNGNELNEPVGKQLKILGCKNEKSVTEASSADGGKPSDKIDQTNEPQKDYIHVRARRGQATDSHSLAERARREKISERMKCLQDLVPGCNKVIGKALVLDEIINYIQSLQQQVEFLSMKLEAVNSAINPAVNGFPPKDPEPPSFDATGMMFGSQAPREYAPIMDTEWLHMHLGGGGGSGDGFERTS
ncbi:hypothetical protein V2J09_012001 [Rumex salicifolius]